MTFQAKQEAKATLKKFCNKIRASVHELQDSAGHLVRAYGVPTKRMAGVRSDAGNCSHGLCQTRRPGRQQDPILPELATAAQDLNLGRRGITTHHSATRSLLGGWVPRTCNWLITMVIVSHEDLKFWDPFQMA